MIVCITSSPTPQASASSPSRAAPANSANATVTLSGNTIAGSEPTADRR
jgi:hypothetical protein